MMRLRNDGTLIWTGPADSSAGRARGTIELPLDLLDEQHDLIDRIFTFAFDALNLQTIELCIRPPAAEGCCRQTGACDRKKSV